MTLAETNNNIICPDTRTDECRVWLANQSCSRGALMYNLKRQNETGSSTQRVKTCTINQVPMEKQSTGRSQSTELC